MIALHGQHETQAFKVRLGEFAVAGLCPRWADELPFFEESQFRRRQVGKFWPKPRKNLPNAQKIVGTRYSSLGW